MTSFVNLKGKPVYTFRGTNDIEVESNLEGKLGDTF